MIGRRGAGIGRRLTPLLLLAILSVPGARAADPAPATAADAAPSSDRAADLAACRRLLDDGRYRQAEQEARRLLREIEAAAGSDSPVAAPALELLADALRRSDGPLNPEAIRAAESALRLREAAHGPESLEAASSQLYLADLLSAGRPDPRALPLAERGLAIRQKSLGDDAPETAAAQAVLGIVVTRAGDLARSRALLEGALPILEKHHGPDATDLLSPLNALALTAAKRGELPTARANFERAVGIAATRLRPDHPRTAAFLAALARVMVDMGDRAPARPMLERALAISESELGEDHNQVAQIMADLAVLRAETGDPAGAQHLFERVLALRTRKLGPSHPDVALALNQLAITHSMQGQHARARRLYEQAVRIAEETLGPADAEVAANLNNLAHALIRLDEYDEARRHLERALGIMEAAGQTETGNHAEMLDTLGDLLVRTGDLQAARRRYQRSLEIHEHLVGPDHLKAVLVRLHLAEVHFRLGAWRDAFDLSLKAESAARRAFLATVPVLTESEGLAYERARLSGLDLALSTLAGPGGGALGPTATRDLWDEVIRSRALVLDEIAARHRSRPADDPAISSLAAELEGVRARLARLVVAGPGREGGAQHRARVESAWQDRERAERALAERSLAFRRDQIRRVAGFQEAAASLPAETALVAFVQYGRTAPVDRQQADRHRAPQRDYFAFVLGRSGSAPIAIPLGSAAAIDRLIGDWVRAVSDAPGGLDVPGGRGEARARQAGARLRRAIWDPLAVHLDGARHVLVIPDGALNLVNLAALPDGAGGYLVEAGPLIHHLSAERDIVRVGGPDHALPGLLVIGGPDFDAPPAGPEVAEAGTAGVPPAGGAPGRVYRGPRSTCGTFTSRRFAPLPSARAEADEIAALWRSAGAGGGGPSDVLLLTGRGAAEGALKRLAPTRGVLHVATHGFFVQGTCGAFTDRGLPAAALGEEVNAAPAGESPLLLTGLALAGANRRGTADADDDEDGILTGEEIASLDLSGVRWAVLSGCETGLGPVEAGEGVLGMRRAFEVAGAGTLIMSLWPVEDLAAQEWMRALYRARLAGATTADSVQRASLTVLAARRAAGRSTHPFFWGAFVAAGDWR